ncbi:MAG: hypothetical protein JXA78_02425 [Anaerolineales bacterium]|nr:hypothetical protein [Anaerolineales bacterium]
MKYAVVVIALVLLAYLVMDFNSRTAELNRLKTEQELVTARLESRQATRDALQTQVAYATSEAAVVRWAHENHMRRPGEHPVVPMQPALSTPASRPRPAVAPTQVSNLEQWLALFIDPQLGE